jgi:hypothetical protein
LLFLLRLGFLGHGTEGEGNLEQRGPAGTGIVIGNNHGDIDVQLVAFVPLEQIRQTMILFRDQHRDPCSAT